MQVHSPTIGQITVPSGSRLAAVLAATALLAGGTAASIALIGGDDAAPVPSAVAPVPERVTSGAPVAEPVSGPAVAPSPERVTDVAPVTGAGSAGDAIKLRRSGFTVGGTSQP
jgi:hypothetical protein